MFTMTIIYFVFCWQIQAKQLEDIFRLMGAQTDKFGVDNMDDIKNQMNLYIQ